MSYNRNINYISKLNSETKFPIFFFNLANEAQSGHLLFLHDLRYVRGVCRSLTTIFHKYKKFLNLFSQFYQEKRKKF